jgi:hypothetical protein
MILDMGNLNKNLVVYSMLLTFQLFNVKDYLRANLEDYFSFLIIAGWVGLKVAILSPRLLHSAPSCADGFMCGASTTLTQNRLCRPQVSCIWHPRSRLLVLTLGYRTSSQKATIRFEQPHWLRFKPQHPLCMHRLL